MKYNTQMINNQNVPKLRFKEFSGEWEKKHGKNLFFNYRAKGRDDLPLYSVTLRRGLVPRDSLDREIREDAEMTSNLCAQVGDLVYNMMRMWQGAVGIAEVECMVSPAYVVLSPKSGVDSKYFNYTFLRERTIYNLWAYSHGLTSDRLRLYYRDFGQIPFMVPSLKEQQKIASFLSAIDTKIEKMNRKKELLEQYKKAMMKKIFSQVLRFKADNGSEFPVWEEKKLKDIAIKKSSNISANKIEKNFGNYIIYGASGILKKVDFFEELEDYISIVKDGAGVGNIFYCKGKSSVLGTMEIIKPKSGCNTYFLYCLLGNINYVKYVTGSTIPHIYFKDYSHEKCGVPSIEEQTKITNFLTALDTKIDLVTKQLDEAKNFKKALLQQMFV